ncbi:hypothetical protein RYX36_008989 [Vicia faba]
MNGFSPVYWNRPRRLWMFQRFFGTDNGCPRTHHTPDINYKLIEFFWHRSSHFPGYGMECSQVGLQYISEDISGCNDRCSAMLQAFQEAIKDYKVPHEKSLGRDFTTKLEVMSH